MCNRDSRVIGYWLLGALRYGVQTAAASWHRVMVRGGCWHLQDTVCTYWHPQIRLWTASSASSASSSAYLHEPKLVKSPIWQMEGRACRQSIFSIPPTTNRFLVLCVSMEILSYASAKKNRPDIPVMVGRCVKHQVVCGGAEGALLPIACLPLFFFVSIFSLSYGRFETLYSRLS